MTDRIEPPRPQPVVLPRRVRTTPEAPSPRAPDPAIAPPGADTLRRVLDALKRL
jgi:hypothetical protein